MQDDYGDDGDGGDDDDDHDADDDDDHDADDDDDDDYLFFSFSPSLPILTKPNLLCPPDNN